MATTSPTGRRTKRIVLVTAALMLIGGAAFAYWTTTGSGSGSATSGTGGTITVNQSGPAITNVNPGAAPQTLSGTFTNQHRCCLPGLLGDRDRLVGRHQPRGWRTASPTTTSSPALRPSATAAPSRPAPESAPGRGLTIAFVNEAAENQDDCKNATVNIAYSAS